MSSSLAGSRRPLKAPVPRQQHTSGALSTSAGGETATFLQFVRLLANKSEEEQRMLVQVAMHEASTRVGGFDSSPSPKVGRQPLVRGGSAELRRNNALRRSTSLDTSDFAASGRGAGVGQRMGGLVGAAYGASVDGRPRSADASQNAGSGGSQLMWGAGLGGTGLGGGRNHPLRHGSAVRQTHLQKQQHAAAAAQAQRQQFARRAAAAVLQAHWRGWQHRRLVRYLRARRTRAMRLDWLWHLEFVTNLLQWHEAAHTVQAAWRSHSSKPHLPDRPSPSKASPPKPSVAAAAATRHPAAKEAPARESKQAQGGNGKKPPSSLAAGGAPAPAPAGAPSDAAAPGTAAAVDASADAAAAAQAAAAPSPDAAPSPRSATVPPADAEPPSGVSEAFAAFVEGALTGGASDGAADGSDKPSTTKRSAGVEVGNGGGGGRQMRGGVPAAASGRATVHWKVDAELEEVRTFPVVAAAPSES